jgi:hypothetical protein
MMSAIRETIEIIDLARAGLDSNNINRQNLESGRPKLVDNLSGWGALVGREPQGCQNQLDKITAWNSTLYTQLVNEDFTNAFKTLDNIIQGSKP